MDLHIEIDRIYNYYHSKDLDISNKDVLEGISNAFIQIINNNKEIITYIKYLLKNNNHQEAYWKFKTLFFEYALHHTNSNKLIMKRNM